MIASIYLPPVLYNVPDPHSKHSLHMLIIVSLYLYKFALPSIGLRDNRSLRVATFGIRFLAQTHRADLAICQERDNFDSERIYAYSCR